MSSALLWKWRLERQTNFPSSKKQSSLTNKEGKIRFLLYSGDFVADFSVLNEGLHKRRRGEMPHPLNFLELF